MWDYAFRRSVYRIPNAGCMQTYVQLHNQSILFWGFESVTWCEPIIFILNFGAGLFEAFASLPNDRNYFSFKSSETFGVGYFANGQESFSWNDLDLACHDKCYKPFQRPLRYNFKSITIQSIVTYNFFSNIYIFRLFVSDKLRALKKPPQCWEGRKTTPSS